MIFDDYSHTTPIHGNDKKIHGISSTNAAIGWNPTNSIHTHPHNYVAHQPNLGNSLKSFGFVDGSVWANDVMVMDITGDDEMI